MSKTYTARSRRGCVFPRGTAAVSYTHLRAHETKANIDALHGCLTDLHEPTELIVRGTSALDELLGRRANAFRRVLDDSAEENPNLTVRFEDAVKDDTY